MVDQIDMNVGGHMKSIYNVWDPVIKKAQYDNWSGYVDTVAGIHCVEASHKINVVEPQGGGEPLVFGSSCSGGRRCTLDLVSSENPTTIKFNIETTMGFSIIVNDLLSVR